MATVRRSTSLCLLMVLVPSLGKSPLFAQPVPSERSRAPLLPTGVLYSAESAPVSHPLQRIRLFRIQPGFVSDLPWLDPESSDTRVAEVDADSGLDWLSLAVGNDNPHFDLRRRGDPGGIGFARVCTQVQLIETEKTAFALGIQAVMPRGHEHEGLGDHQGPTVVTPALSLFHELDEGTAFQAYVGTNVPVLNAATQAIRRSVQYGLALQRALGTDSSDPLNGLYVSFGALGQVRRESDRLPVQWEVTPGLHWKPAENWWISGGFVLPVGTAKGNATQQWQLTCSWQY